MKYKYIGTEEQLIEYGFIKSVASNNTYIRIGEREVVIFLEKTCFERDVFLANEPNRYMKQRYIQDLIDDKLVEVIE